MAFSAFQALSSTSISNLPSGSHPLPCFPSSTPRVTRDHMLTFLQGQLGLSHGLGLW